MRIAIACLLVTAAGASGCAGDASYTKPLTPVRVEAVQRAQPTSAVRYSAGLEPRTRVDLAFKAAGYVDRLATVDGRVIQDGDRVTRGMTLASVRTTDYQDKIDQATSLLAEAEAGLAAARPAFERAERLYASGSLTRPEFEEARAALQAMDARVSGARAVLQEAENARADTNLVSPIDGLVLRRLVEVGSLVGPGVGGFVLADVSEMHAVFGAPDTLLQHLRIGQTAPVQVEAVPERQFTGRITKISSAADVRSRIFDVELTLPNPRGDLRVGMVASIGIDLARLNGAADDDRVGVLLIPLSAVVRSGGTGPDSYAVFVVEGPEDATVVRRRPIALGEVVGSRIEVREGLVEGQPVVVGGATIVDDGEQVRVVR